MDGRAKYAALIGTQVGDYAVVGVRVHPDKPRLKQLVCRCVCGLDVYKFSWKLLANPRCQHSGGLQLSDEDRTRRGERLRQWTADQAASRTDDWYVTVFARVFGRKHVSFARGDRSNQESSVDAMHGLRLGGVLLRRVSIEERERCSMKPVDMTILHEPPERIGDCFRCSIASILELPPAEVSHFCGLDPWTDEPSDKWRGHLLDFLGPRGLYYFEMQFDVDALPNWSHVLDCHHTISGISPRGTRHVCVGRRGEVIHDPHPSRLGIQPDKGEWIVGFICKL